MKTLTVQEKTKEAHWSRETHSEWLQQSNRRCKKEHWPGRRHFFKQSSKGSEMQEIASQHITKSPTAKSTWRVRHRKTLRGFGFLLCAIPVSSGQAVLKIQPLLHRKAHPTVFKNLAAMLPYLLSNLELLNKKTKFIHWSWLCIATGLLLIWRLQALTTLCLTETFRCPFAKLWRASHAHIVCASYYKQKVQRLD